MNDERPCKFIRVIGSPGKELGSSQAGPRKNVGADGERSHKSIGMSDARDAIRSAARTGGPPARRENQVWKRCEAAPEPKPLGFALAHDLAE